MLQAYKLVSTYSGVLNDAAVEAHYNGDKYKAMDAVIQSTQAQIQQQKENIKVGVDMINSGKVSQKVLDQFTGRWAFMKDILTHLTEQNAQNGSQNT
jgi:hypothetical protein